MSYIQILPWVLLALNICRLILILISFKYQRFSRSFIYFNYFYTALQHTLPNLRGQSEISFVNMQNIIFYLYFAFDFWVPTIFAIA